MTRTLARVLAATAIGFLATMAGATAAGAAPDQTVASPTQTGSQTLLAYQCGGNLVKDPSGVGTLVIYRHCTSGSDSLSVRAIIGLGPDGPCTTVGPNQSKQIYRYVSPAYFDHIARC
jgi:hypothetical protein